MTFRRFTFSAAPEQHASGVLLLEKGSFRLRVVVVPKAWRGEDAPCPEHVHRWSPGMAELSVCVGEGERFTLLVEPGAPSEELVSALWADALISRTGAGTLLSAEIRSDLSGICSCQQDAEPERADHLSDAVHALGLSHGQLVIRAVGRGAIRGGGTCFGRLAVAQEFVRMAETSLNTLRPGYVAVSSHGSMPQGRPRALDLALVSVGGDYRIHSTASRLRMSTPALGVLATMIREVVLETAAWSTQAEYERVKGFQQLADNLHFAARRVAAVWPTQGPSSEVALGIVDAARKQADTLGLGELFHLGEVVLNRTPVSQGGGAGVTIDTYNVSVDTAKVWERVVADRLRDDGFLVADRHTPETHFDDLATPSPWATNTRSRLPDLIFRRGGRLCVGDAKYRMARAPESLAAIPTAEDLYQVFTYGQMTSVASTAVNEVHLFYPTRSSKATVIVEATRASDPPLHISAFGFPPPLET